MARYAAAAAGALVLVLGIACAWLWAPWRYFTAAEVDRVAFPLRDVGLAFPPGRAGIDYFGTLRMNVYIDAQGRVERVEVLEATVPASFRASVVRAFEQARFEPARRWGRAVMSVKKVEVRFDAPVPSLNRGP